MIIEKSFFFFWRGGGRCYFSFLVQIEFVFVALDEFQQLFQEQKKAEQIVFQLRY